MYRADLQRNRLKRDSGSFGMRRQAAALQMLAALLLHTVAHAGTIAYDAAENRVWVSGFTEENPATLCDVLAADEDAGWGIVEHDRAEETFTLRAALWIGTDEDFGTFFQIGRPGFPRETLVLHGDLHVNPPRVSGQRYDLRYLVSNRLTLGDPARPDIQATVIMACAEPGQYSVRVSPGPMPEDGMFLPIGDWFMFHSRLRAADPEYSYRASIALSHAGINYHIVASAFSNWSGTLFPSVVTRVGSWMPADVRALRGMRFENGGTVTSGSYLFGDSLFRNLASGTAIGDAIRCRFERNRDHFRLAASHTGVVFTDCEFDAPEAPPSIPRSTRNEAWLRNYSVYRASEDFSLITNPGVIERVSLPVRVLDGRGRPVRRAFVFVEAPHDTTGLAVQRRFAATGPDGLTPDDAETRALVITRRERRPTNNPREPEVVTHTYRLRVEADGYEPYTLEFDSAVELPRPLEVTLEASR